MVQWRHLRGEPNLRGMRKTFLALLVAGCAAGPQWQKDGGTKEALEADLYLCSEQAPNQVQPRVQGPSGTPSGLGGERKAAFNAMAEREGERMQKDQKAIGACMRAKGYSQK
jgi:hypothetical protein